jgi:hypothetical protein
MFGVLAFYAVVAWIGFEMLAPSIGWDLAGALVLFAGLFAIHVAQKLGERAQSWRAARRP